jgi:hypothetical protein
MVVRWVRAAGSAPGIGDAGSGWSLCTWITVARHVPGPRPPSGP